jgi:hypothetical protein
MTIEAMCEQAIKEDKNGQTTSYIGWIWTIEQNHKLRQVYDSLLNHPCIKKIGRCPIVLKWIPKPKEQSESDISDISDIKTEKINTEKIINCNLLDDKIQETMSGLSDLSDRNTPVPLIRTSVDYAKSVLLNSVLPRTSLQCLELGDSNTFNS